VYHIARGRLRGPNHLPHQDPDLLRAVNPITADTAIGQEASQMMRAIEIKSTRGATIIHGSIGMVKMEKVIVKKIK
jgi:hypothetical protein